MADIRHSIAIDALPGEIEPLVSTGEGLAAWWAADVSKLGAGAVDLGFFNRSTVYRLLPEKIDDGMRWRCESGAEWAGTSIVFRLQPSEKQTVLAFSHEGWAAETSYFISCNTVWGHLMFKLKLAAERPDAARPLFTKSGMDLQS